MLANNLIKSKRGAFELSVTTIVIIVIGMTLLILGIVLVRNIFSGATEATDLINNNVKAQINQLFNEDNAKSVVYLPYNEAVIEKNKKYNIGFAIRNTVQGESEPSAFTYEVRASEVEQGCQLTLERANSFIVLGRLGGPIQIRPGDPPEERVIQVRAGEDAPLCSITYDVVVKKEGVVYDTNFFILNVK